MLNRRGFLTAAVLAPAVAQERQVPPVVVKAKRKPPDAWILPIVTYAPYAPLLTEMGALNRNVYALADYFDGRR